MLATVVVLALKLFSHSQLVSVVDKGETRH